MTEMIQDYLILDVVVEYEGYQENNYGGVFEWIFYG